MKNIIVLYHASCWDGFGAAWSAWKKFGNKADYFAVEHQENPPVGLINKEIYLVDFCYIKEIMDKMIKDNKKVVVLDHHITRKDVVSSMEGSVFDNTHSGSIISWKYFNPSKKIPKILEYIQDIDLWKFKISKTKEITIALDLEPKNFKSWDKSSKKIENAKTRKEFIKKGEIIMEYQNHLFKILASSARKAIIDGIECMVLNAPHLFASQIGAIIRSKGAHLVVIWTKENGAVHVSLRSDDKVDSAKLGEKYGGGGHKGAGGFKLNESDPVPWKLI